MESKELRCKHCKTLLGTLESDGVNIHRGGMEATFPDASTAVIRCYRCSKTTVFTIGPRAMSS